MAIHFPILFSQAPNDSFWLIEWWPGEMDSHGGSLPSSGCGCAACDCCPFFRQFTWPFFSFSMKWPPCNRFSFANPPAPSHRPLFISLFTRRFFCRDFSIYFRRRFIFPSSFPSLFHVNGNAEKNLVGISSNTEIIAHVSITDSRRIGRIKGESSGKSDFCLFVISEPFPAHFILFISDGVGARGEPTKH